VVLDHRSAAMQQEMVQIGLQQRRKCHREQEDDGACIEECNGGVTPARVCFLDERTNMVFRVWVEGEGDCVDEGQRATVHMWFGFGSDGGGKGHAQDEENASLAIDQVRWVERVEGRGCTMEMKIPRTLSRFSMKPLTC